MHRFIKSKLPHSHRLSCLSLGNGLASTSSSSSSSSSSSNLPEKSKPSEVYWYSKRKNEAMVGPRFEQTNMDAQPNPMPSIDLIDQQPIRKVHQRVVACDGETAAGHPRVYINLDQPGSHSCGYCGLRFELEHHH